MLLYQRNVGDWAFVILNRLHANNFRQLFVEIDSFQLDDGLLMYSTRSGAVFGLWIYSEEDKEQFCVWFERIVEGGSEVVSVDESSSMVAVCEEDSGVSLPPANKSRSGGSLVDMLHRAVEKHQKQQNVPLHIAAASVHPVHKQGNNVLEQLFSSAHSSPAKSPQTITEPTRAFHQLSRMSGFVRSVYPGMNEEQFRKTATNLLLGDEIFWEDLYNTYTR